MYMNIILTALELGLISGITTLALFLSYEQLNVCDLSTDGCFTLGAVVGVSVALSGHPHLAFFAAIIAGMISGFVVAILQTYIGIDSLLSGIVVNTGLYSINIAIMEGSSILNMNRVPSIFIQAREFFSPMPFREFYRVIVVLIVVILLVILLSAFLKTRIGLAIRATGNNKDMVKASSVNPYMTTIVGLVIANAFTALSGSILAELQKGVNIDIGTGQVTIALASLLIGRTFIRKYLIVFDPDEKRIGFYQEKLKINNKTNNDLNSNMKYFSNYLKIIIIIILIAIIFSILGIFYGKKLFGIRKKFANELIDDYYQYEETNNQNKNKIKQSEYNKKNKEENKKQIININNSDLNIEMSNYKKI